MTGHLQKIELRAYPEGFIISEAGFFDYHTNGWSWVQSTIAQIFECAEDDVRCNGENQVTIKGQPIATIKTGTYT